MRYNRLAVFWLLLFRSLLIAQSYTEPLDTLVASNPIIFGGEVHCLRESLLVNIDFENGRYSLISKYLINPSKGELQLGFPVAVTRAGDSVRTSFDNFSVAIGDAIVISPEHADNTLDTIKWNLTGSGSPFNLEIAYNGLLYNQLSKPEVQSDFIWRFRLRDGVFQSLTGDTIHAVFTWSIDTELSDPVITTDYPNGFWFKKIKPVNTWKIEYTTLKALILPEDADSVLTLKMGPSWINSRPPVYDYAAHFDTSAQTHQRYLEILRRYERYKSSPMMIEQYLKSLKAHELFFLRHYIYASHGYRFKNERISSYFNMISEKNNRWYQEALSRGYSSPRPYVQSLIDQTRELEREQSGYPDFDQDYRFIIGNYNNISRYSPDMYRVLLDALSYDEMFFLAHQVNARNGYKYNDLKIIEFFSKWQNEAGLIDSGWFDEAQKIRFMGLGSQQQSFRDTLFKIVEERMLW